MIMPNQDTFHVPDYQDFSSSIAPLGLPVSGAFLHGIMCGYLCAGKPVQGESYLQALVAKKKDFAVREATLAMFHLYSISQAQLANFNFEFELLLPDDELALPERARAFSEWCDGFTQGMTVSGIGFDSFEDEEAQDALQHITEFADLDCEAISIDEEDEKAFMEVNEYARMAVLRLHQELSVQEVPKGKDKTKH